jgi:L-asparagine transporter-like permease
LHNTTFIFIFLIIIISVISLRLYEQDNEKLKKISSKIDLISYVTITVLYFTIITFTILTFS